MRNVFTDGRWAVALRVSNALTIAGLLVSTDTQGRNGMYTVYVDMREYVAAKQVIAALDIQEAR